MVELKPDDVRPLILLVLISENKQQEKSNKSVSGSSLAVDLICTDSQLNVWTKIPTNFFVFCCIVYI